jgi:hypothetical protein
MKLIQTHWPQSVSLSIVAATGLLGIRAAGASSYSDVILADKPVAYYRFEDTAGSLDCLDSSPAGMYSGTLNLDDSAVWPKLEQPGIGSNSISFHAYTDGGVLVQKSYVSVPFNPDLNQPGPFTTEGWVRPTSVGGTDEWRSPIGNFGGWGDSSGWFFYQSPGVGGASSWIWVQKGGAIWVGGVPVRKNQWDHLAASFDGTTVTFYVNGVNSGSANASTAAPNSGNPFCIGQRADNNCFFDGNIDEVAFYTNALSEAQIQSHYQAGLTNFYTGPIGAYITKDPAPVTSYAGRRVSFLVGADGTAPLSYQWYKGTSLLAGETSDTLAFTCAYADNNATYTAVVTNVYGSATSAPVALTVSTELLLASSPAAITRTVGSMAAFRVESGGALPVTYKWYKGASLITGATNETLWLSSVQLSDDGSTYYAQVSNPWMSTNTEPATLNVAARAAEVPITGYAKLIMAEHPVGYWRLDEPEGSGVAVDAAGSFNGEYDSAGALAYTPGIFTFGASSGIPYETNNAVVVTNGARIKIPNALELNPYGPFAAEAWLNPDSLSVDSGDYRTAFSSEGNGVGGPIGWLLYQQPNHTWAWVLFADNWVSSFVGDPLDTIQANTWYHVVLQYDGAMFQIYVNGRLTVSQAYDIFVPNRNGAINLGWRSDNDWKPFAGAIDDVAFYNKALTPEQIQAHYLASVRLTMTRSGDNVILSWPFGTLQQADTVPGDFAPLSGATSPYTNAPGISPKFYRVKVQ